MKITIFGATGRTGIEIVKQAVDRKHEVTVFVRSADKLGEMRGKVSVVEGDLTSVQSVARAIAGSSAVISALGPTKESIPGFLPNATRVIVAAMKQTGVRRLITMTGAGVRTDGDNPRLIDRAIVGLMKMIAKKPLNDGVQHADVVKKSGLDWTVVRAPMLKDSPVIGVYEVGMVGSDHLSVAISRADIATFILDIVEKNKHVHELPVVAHKR